uniref:Uncharacterized protein n=1 Tax=viral metagenome TaxID=1070528 RepID=A0A6H1Z6S9_9ZZZZ
MDLFLKLMPYIVSLVGLAERFISKPKSGIEKKALVVSGVKTVVDGMTAASSGGQKETWKNISGAVDEFIDAAAAVRFPTEIKK